MQKRFVLPCFVLALASVACGGASAREAEMPEIAAGDSPMKSQLQRLRGHYSTHDGASGFSLDRTRSPWRAKLDGSAKISTLVESFGPLSTKEYRSEDKEIWLRVNEDGDVLLFQGPKQHEGVRVIRDADLAGL